MKTGVWLSTVVLLLSLAGAAPAAQECPAGLEPVIEFRMFFGLTDKDGTIVTEDQRFLAETITSPFPDGLTVFDARGQWQPPSGELQREPVKVAMARCRPILPGA